MNEHDSIAALFHQVHAQPDDDHLRLVLADALSSIGDPRGEFIQLQLQPHSDLGRRVMELIQRHGLTWLGSLRGSVVPHGYERGFLASCMVVANIEYLCDREEWSTVHTIALPEYAVGFQLHPIMRSLRCLTGLQPDTLLDLANNHQPALAKLAIELSYSPKLDRMLERYLPANPVATLTIEAVPYEHADLLRRAASRHSRMTLDLRVLPPANAR